MSLSVVVVWWSHTVPLPYLYKHEPHHILDILDVQDGRRVNHGRFPSGKNHQGCSGVQSEMPVMECWNQLGGGLQWSTMIQASFAPEMACNDAMKQMTPHSYMFLHVLAVDHANTVISCCYGAACGCGCRLHLETDAFLNNAQWLENTNTINYQKKMVSTNPKEKQSNPSAHGKGTARNIHLSVSQ